MALSLAQNAIERHQEYLKQYSALRFGYSGHRYSNNPTVDHFLLFLDKVLQDPRIAYYPNSMEASAWDFGNDDRKDDEIQTDILTAVTSARSSELATFGVENQWLNGKERRDEWRDALLEPRNQFHHLAMLLTMLPNLRSIKMVHMDPCSEPLREMIWAIAAANCDPASPAFGRALGKLAEVSINSGDPEFGEHLDPYSPLLALPSLRFAQGFHVDADLWGLPGESFGHDSSVLRPRHIEEIKIRRSHVSINNWEWILGSIENLKRFTYEYDLDFVRGQEEDVCDQLVALLKEHASHTLTLLDLTEFAPSESGCTCVGDLKDFKMLEVLRIDDTVFQREAGGEIMRLVDVLPASIRTVKLVAQISHAHPADLFIGLAEEKGDKLPQLQKINLEGKYEIEQEMLDKLEGAGIAISRLSRWQAGADGV
ncbi:MAG: hypothetical protein Q9170_002051 [Blastenia crenularia]